MEENKILVVIDMQNDFIDGSLGTPEAQAIVPAVVDKINNWNGSIFCTMDGHYDDTYLDTQEGKLLPIKHCIFKTEGHRLNTQIRNTDKFLQFITIHKNTFATEELASLIRMSSLFGTIDYIELVGVCTDICVVSNALLLRSSFPDTEIAVDASCCAGTTPEAHEAALKVMKSCLIKVINE